MGESAGLTAVDEVNSPSWAGTYNGGITLGQTGIGDGSTCPLFDGVDGYVNVFSAALQGAFNGAEGSVMAYARMSGAGVWTDGITRVIVHCQADGYNYVNILKLNTPNNTLRWRYVANDVVEAVTLVTTSAEWMCVALTWSKAAEEVKAYYNGVQTGVTQVALGVWAGNIATALIGSFNVTPLLLWSGREAHVALWDRVLSPSEVSDLFF